MAQVTCGYPDPDLYPYLQHMGMGTTSGNQSYGITTRHCSSTVPHFLPSSFHASNTLPLKLTIHETSNGVHSRHNISVFLNSHDISVFPSSFQTITALEVWLTCEIFHEVAAFISSFQLLESLMIAVTGWESEEVPTMTGKADLAKIGSLLHLWRFQDRWVKVV